MHSDKIIIKSRLGLHMRPAAEVAKLAAGFDAVVVLYKGNKIAHVHSVVELLTLGAFHRDELKVTAVGNDAQEALKAVTGYFNGYSDDHESGKIDEAA